MVTFKNSVYKLIAASLAFCLSSGAAVGAQEKTSHSLALENFISLSLVSEQDISSDTKARIFKYYDYQYQKLKCQTESCGAWRFIVIIYRLDEYPQSVNFISDPAFGWANILVKQLVGSSSKGQISACKSVAAGKKCVVEVHNISISSLD